MSAEPPHLGVVIVTYDAADVIDTCLRSLMAARGVILHVVIVDNASRDGTARRVREVVGPELLEPRHAGRAGVALIGAGVNGGFAAGVNLGLGRLSRRAELDRFWILNPDCEVPPTTPARLARHRHGDDRVGLIANRVVYADDPERIQIDGGVIDRRTGVTHNLGQFAPADGPAPDPGRMDFVSGASLVATRAFLSTAGPMEEDYFLYYEEVDWALRRDGLEISWCADAPVLHKAGAVIGSQRLGSVASPFSQYFKHRARAKFLRRHFPQARIGGALWSIAKAAQLFAKGHRVEAEALMRGYFGGRPPRKVIEALDPGARARIGV